MSSQPCYNKKGLFYKTGKKIVEKHSIFLLNTFCTIPFNSYIQKEGSFAKLEYICNKNMPFFCNKVTHFANSIAPQHNSHFFDSEHYISCAMSHIWYHFLFLRGSSCFLPRHRVKYVRGGSRLHPVSVRGSEQAERHQGDLHPLHLRHRHQERSVRVRRGNRRHHQKQSKGLRTVLEAGSYLVRLSCLCVTCTLLACRTCCVYLCAK